MAKKNSPKPDVARALKKRKKGQSIREVVGKVQKDRRDKGKKSR